MRPATPALALAGAHLLLLFHLTSPADSDLPFPLARTSGGRDHPTVIDITDSPYSALGDGATDNSAAFRRAIAALNEAGGGTLLVPSGVFRTAPLSLGSNTTLELPFYGSTVAAKCNLSWSAIFIVLLNLMDLC